MCAPWMRREGSALKVENYLLVRVTTVILSHSARPRKTVYGMSSSAATPLLNGISMILTPNKKCSPCLRIGVHHVSGRKREGGVAARSSRFREATLARADGVVGSSRSEERRVGKECSTGGSPEHEREKGSS